MTNEQHAQMTKVYGKAAADAEMARNIKALAAIDTKAMLTCRVCGGRLSKRTGNCRDCEG